MNQVYSERLLRHGVVAMLTALLGGFGLAFSMVGSIGLSPLPPFAEWQLGTPGGWRVLHLGMMMNGLMAIVMALCLRSFSLPERRAALIYRGVLIAVWGNFCFYLMSVFAPNHGLGFESNRLGAANLPGALAYIGGIVAAVTLFAALLALLRAPRSQ